MRARSTDLKQAYSKRPRVSLGEPSRAAKKKKPEAVAKRSGVVIEDDSPPARRKVVQETIPSAVVEPRPDASSPKRVEVPASVPAAEVREHSPAQAAPADTQPNNPGASARATPAVVKPPPPASVLPVSVALPLSIPTRSSGPGSSGGSSMRYIPQWSVTLGDSGLSSPGVARELVEGIFLPRDRDILGAMDVNKMLDEAFTTAVRHAQEVALLQEGIFDYRRRVHEAEEDRRVKIAKAEEASRARVAEAVAARVAAESCCEGLRSQFHKVQVVLEAREESLSSVRKQLEEKEAALDAARAAHRTERSRAEAAESSLADSRNEAEALQSRIDSLKRSKGDLSGQVLSLKVKLAEVGTAAVADYKASDLCRRDIAEASIDAYVRGFKDFYQQATRSFPGLDFSSFEPDFDVSDDEAADTNGEGAGEEAPEGPAKGAGEGSSTRTTSPDGSRVEVPTLVEGVPERQGKEVAEGPSTQGDEAETRTLAEEPLAAEAATEDAQTLAAVTSTAGVVAEKTWAEEE